MGKGCCVFNLRTCFRFGFLFQQILNAAFYGGRFESCKFGFECAI